MIADAIVVVVHESVLFMRAMSHRRESMCDEFFPGCDYQQQIRELADVCDNLVPGLRPNGPRRPRDALQFTWDSRSRHQQDWIRHCLAVRGVRVEDLISTAPGRRRVMPG
ncbi:hypothetical protein ACIRSS_04095 [Amycolatopsis sp. NPDC101161]|uniref:hypothetical protein n=1 Tax=Amycolatopsis sp. NPDC101161 TaxID=3363940 RepID=UPI003828CA0D